VTLLKQTSLISFSELIFKKPTFF